MKFGNPLKLLPMRTICIKARLRKDSLEEIRAWFQTLNERKDEVLASLANEGVVVESAFLDHQGDELYLIYYLKAEDIAKAYDVFEKSILPIDQYFKDCWAKYCEGRIILEPLLDLERFERQ